MGKGGKRGEELPDAGGREREKKKNREEHTVKEDYDRVMEEGERRRRDELSVI